MIFYSGKRFVDKIIKNSGNIGTALVGLVTVMDAALNLKDRLKKGKGSGRSESTEPDKIRIQIKIFR